MKEENLNILSFSENDQKEPALIAALENIFDLISVNCEELDSIEEVLSGYGKELNVIVSMIDSIDKRLRALEEAKNTQTD